MDAAVPHGEGTVAFDGDAAALLAARVGNLAGVRLAVGDGQGLAVGDLDSILAVSPGDGLAVEAEVDVVAHFPRRSKLHVVDQVIVACLGGKAGGAVPCGPDVVLAVAFVGAVGLAANRVAVLGQEHKAAAAVFDQAIVAVVARKNSFVRRATHDRGAVLRSR